MPPAGAVLQNFTNVPAALTEGAFEQAMAVGSPSPTWTRTNRYLCATSQLSPAFDQCIGRATVTEDLARQLHAGFFDTEKGRVEPAPNPFVSDRVLTMCPE
jgi:hypothetical protein